MNRYCSESFMIFQRINIYNVYLNLYILWYLVHLLYSLTHTHTLVTDFNLFNRDCCENMSLCKQFFPTEMN